MELKCSLFGHDYADYDVERERTDHGTEIVRTVRTTEACRRCGHTRILSENTEIAATAVPDGPDSPDLPEDEAAERSGVSASMASATTANESNGVAGSATRSSPEPGNSHRENGRTDRSAGQRSPETLGPTAATVGSRSLAESELWCPACEFAEPALGSALRAGDSCPACTRGYLRQ